MPKYKVTISLAKYETILDAEDSNTAQNIAEEQYFQYLMDKDLNFVEVEELK